MVPVTFGQVFAQGDVPGGAALSAMLADGTPVRVQVDPKATHADGSLRHAIISMMVPSLAAGQTLPVGLMPNSGMMAGSTPVPPSSLLNKGFTANVSADVGGDVYLASAESLLAGPNVATWLSGPLATEWIVSAPLRNAAGQAHPHLSAQFAIRFYPWTSQARVDVTVENDWAYEPGPQNFTYNAKISVGSQTVYSKDNLTHYHHTRWRKTFWWGAAPAVHVKHSTAYLIRSKALPNFDQSVSVSATAIAGFNAKVTGAGGEPMGTGAALNYMPNTGGRPDIGLLPGWSAAYLLSMDKDAKNAMLVTADMAGSWSAHYRDRNTGRVVSLVDYPYMTILGRSSDTYNPATKKYEAFPACGGVCTNANTLDSAHQPAFAYLPYLVTGDYYYLEELQFYAMYNMFQHNPGYRENIKGLVKPDQIRGQAWSMRTLAEAAYITPDGDPLKPQFQTFLANNLSWYNATYANNPVPDNSLGALINSNSLAYNNGTGIAPWQDDFFTSAIGHVAELGFQDAKPLLTWKSKFVVDRMGTTDYCWILASAYNVTVKSSNTSPVFTNIADVYRASNPDTLTSLACASSEMAGQLGLATGEMVGYSSSNTGYPSNMQPALAYAVDAGYPGAAQAWTTFSNRTVKPDYWNGPQFAIVPR
jgi:hypothetical protein